MEAICLQENLAKALGPVSRVVSSKPGLPVLANVLIRTEKGRLKLSATDLEIGVDTWVGAEIKDGGEVTVSAKMFAEFINSLPEGKVKLQLDDQILKVTAENNSASFNILPADEFPAIPSAEGKPMLTFEADDFVEALERVVFSASTDDSRPVLTGVKFEGVKKKLSLIGIDGFRLSKVIMDVEKSFGKEMSLLVPARALQELIRVASSTDDDNDEKAEAEGQIEMHLLKDKNQVIFRAGDVDLSSRLIEGKYPDYKQIIPTGYQTKVQVEKDELQNAVKIANILARSVIGNKTLLKTEVKKGTLSISAVLAEVGENQSEIEVKAEGEDVEIAFSAKFLIDMLNNIDGDELEIEMNDSTSPGLFRVVGDKKFMHIIMPMRLE